MPIRSTTSDEATTVSDWPAVPPAPVPNIPVVPPVAPEPVSFLLGRPVAGPRNVLPRRPEALTPPALLTQPAQPRSTQPAPLAVAPVSPGLPPLPPPPRSATPVTRLVSLRRPTADLTLAAPSVVTEPEPLAQAPWRPAFATISGVAILIVALAVTLPMWVAVYRAAWTGSVAVVLALSLMMLGTCLAGLASWAMLIELRGRAGSRGDRTGIVGATVGAQVAMFVVALGVFIIAAALTI